MAATNGEKPLELSVRNFGPIAEADIELRPLSVFVGPSNTGKSYLATLIYALHQFFGAYAGRSDIRGPADTPFSVVPYPTIPAMRADLTENDLGALCSWGAANAPKCLS